MKMDGPMKRSSATLVVGLGNPILTDDGVGIHVVREVAARCQRGGVTFVEASAGGLRLLDTIAGYDCAIIVDAVQTRAGKPGDVYRLCLDDLRAWQTSFYSVSTHSLSLPDALALGRSLGLALPGDDALVVIAVAVEDVLTFSEACTAAVAAAIPRAVEAVLAELIGG